MDISNLKNKAQIGAFGEHMVAAELLALGWDAILANISISNVSKFDLVCVNPQTGKPVLIQVKTSITKSFSLGCSLEDITNGTFRNRVVGPWIFVHIDNGELHYYILSKDEIVKLAEASNDWYCNSVKRTTPLKQGNPAAVTLDWLKGDGKKAGTSRGIYHEQFINPLNGVVCENQWENIWK